MRSFGAKKTNIPLAIKICSRLLLPMLLMGIVLVASGQSKYKYRNAIDDPYSVQKSLVLDVYGEYSVRGTRLHENSVQRMLNTGVRKLTGIEDESKAWRKFIHDEDTVAIVFSSIGSRDLGTNTELASIMLKTFYNIGFKPKNFMLIGLHELPKEAEGTVLWKYGWQKEKVDFVSDQDYLAAWLENVTAIINIPSIMDDNILGLRCSMANLAFPVIKSPARFKRLMRVDLGSQGDPFIPDIYNLPQIKGKVRLNIANALRVLYNGGPTVAQVYIDEPGMLVFSTDPVALDRRALELLLRLRHEKPMPGDIEQTLQAPYLKTAQAMGIGYNDMSFIKYRKIGHDRY